MDKKILFLSPTGSLGGAERVLVSMVNSLRLIWPEYLIKISCLGKGPLLDELNNLGLSFTLKSLPNQLSRLGDAPLGSLNKLTRLLSLVISAPSAFRIIKEWGKIIRKEDPFLIHSNGFKTHLISALASPTTIPILWHLHDFVGERFLMRRLLKMVWRPGIQAIAISKAVADDFSMHLPNCPVTLWYNTVDCNKYHPGKFDGNWLDDEAGLSGGFKGLRVGLVATYAKWKGHDVFLRACQLLIREFRGAIRFYLIGGPVYLTAGSQWSFNELRARINQLKLADVVGIIPFQKDSSRVYKSLDIVVHASTRREPFGLVIAEAMACGKPVVAALHGGASEIGVSDVDCVGHDPGSPASLASSLSTLILNLPRRQELSHNARSRILANFSQEKMMKNWQELISGINKS